MGAPDLHLRAGSSLRLVCTLRQSTEPPSYVFWYHEKRMINYDQGVQVIADRSSSVLLLQEADKSHNGNYTCSPSNAIPASINVHVLNATAGKKNLFIQFLMHIKKFVIFRRETSSNATCQYEFIFVAISDKLCYFRVYNYDYVYKYVILKCNIFLTYTSDPFDIFVMF